MAPYLVAVLPCTEDETSKVKIYLPIDSLKFLDDKSQDWRWDNSVLSLVDQHSAQSMHGVIPDLPVAKQCDSNTWDFRVSEV
jgi:hypothetical protein